MVRAKLALPRGILRLHVGSPIPGYARFWPDEDLASFVDHAVAELTDRTAPPERIFDGDIAELEAEALTRTDPAAAERT